MIAFFGFSGAAVLLVASIYVKDPLLAMCAMGLASFATISPCPAVGALVWMWVGDMPERFQGA